MKFFLKSALLFLLLCQEAFAQNPPQGCNGSTTFTVSPLPTNGTYPPGTVVYFCITMNGYSQAGANWLEGFDINFGPGWQPGSVVPNLPPQPPANCGGGGGSWIWLNSSTSTTPPIQSFGPGYFFDLNGNGIAGDDFGDAGSCVWTFCFHATVGNNVGAGLAMSVVPLSDGLAGSWGSNSCDGQFSTNLLTNATTVGGSCVSAVFVSQDSVSCAGAADGSLTISATQGQAPYQYSVNGSAFLPTGPSPFTIPGLAAGQYSVVVQDAANCSFTLNNLSVLSPAPVSVIQTSIQDVDCFGNANGSFQFQVNGGSPGYTYTIDGAPSALPSAQNLSGGTYVVVATDAYGCTSTSSFTILEPAQALSALLVSNTPVDCFAASTGILEFSGSGGTTPFSYSLNGGASQPSGIFANLPSGNYSVLVTDNNGCTATLASSITQPAAPLFAAMSAQTHVACFGDATGSLSFQAFDGTAPYTFSLSGTSNTTGAFTGLAAGNYSVLVTDANGCTTQAPASLNQPAAALSGFILSQTNVLCSGQSTGQFEIIGTNGTPAYTFTCNGVTNGTGIFSSLPAANYNVIITDQNNCTAVLPVNLTSPAALSANTLNITPVSCFGGSDGALQVGGVNGNAPYSFELNGSVNNTGVYNGLSSGNYSVIVTDQNACTFTQMVTISQPLSALQAQVVSQQDVSCFGLLDASFTISASGGTSPYTFATAGQNNVTGAFGSLAAGNYQILITDANSCTFSLTAQISEPAQLTLSVINATDISCFGGNDGSISVAANGGTQPYVYSGIIPSNSNGQFANLPAAAYQIVVTDLNNCTASVNQVLSQPNVALSGAIAAQTNVLCFGATTGSVTLSAAGGTPGYQFGLSGSPFSPSPVFNALSAGSYTYVITDANGCTTQVPVIISQPAAPVSIVLLSSVDVACFGGNDGSLSVQASNGLAPFSYSIGGPINNTGVFSGLTAATYGVTATDANGCPATLPVNIAQPATALSVSTLSSQNPVCNGFSNGSATVQASGGTAPAGYSFVWNTVPPVLTPQLNNVPAGTYQVLVTDGNGCTQTHNVVLNEPNFQINVIGNFSLCQGQDSLMMFSSLDGAAPVVYSLTNQNTASVTLGSSQLLAPPVSTTYQVIATDANGCVSPPLSFTLTVNEVPSATFTADLQEGCLPVCINFSVVNAQPGINYNWSMGDGNTSAGSILNHCYSDVGLFDVALQAVSLAGCSSFIIDSSFIEVHEVPLVQFQVSPRFMSESEARIFIENKTDTACSFSWSFGDGNIAGDVFEPFHDYSGPGEYCVLLTAMNEGGCESSDQECVTVVNDFAFFIPNSFTPNGDATNDVFRAFGTSVGEQSLRIFSRWGEKIFEQSSNHIPIEWNGDGFPDGVYAYEYAVTDLFGKIRYYSGTVSLLR